MLAFHNLAICEFSNKLAFLKVIHGSLAMRDMVFVLALVGGTIWVVQQSFSGEGVLAEEADVLGAVG